MDGSTASFPIDSEFLDPILFGIVSFLADIVASSIVSVDSFSELNGGSSVVFAAIVVKSSRRTPETCAK